MNIKKEHIFIAKEIWGFPMGWKDFKTYKEVRRLVDEVKIIDTHEHLPPEDIRLAKSDTLLNIFPLSRIKSGLNQVVILL